MQQPRKTQNIAIAARIVLHKIYFFFLVLQSQTIPELRSNLQIEYARFTIRQAIHRHTVPDGKRKLSGIYLLVDNISHDYITTGIL